jgi:putative peptide zinc metalloprotease protein
MSWRLGWALTAALLFVAALGCDAATPAPSSSPTPSPAAADQTATPTPDFDAGVILEEFPPGGPRNEVRLENTENGRFKARASIKMHRIPNDDVNPVNVAFAQATCTDCQTIAVAMQVVLYKRGAHNVSPQNIAVAANVGCTRCVTIARAMQWVIPVDDLNAVPRDVDALVKDMNKELQFLSSIKTIDQITSDEANTHLQNVLNQYAELQQYLSDAIQKQTADNATPTPSPAASPTATPSASPAGTASPLPSASPTASP